MQKLLLPTLIGVIIALSILLWAPHWVLPGVSPSGLPLVHSSQTEQHTTQPMNYALEPGEWGGPVSYSKAVKAAAPSVVNIYTRKLIQTKINPLLNDPLLRRFFGNVQQPRDRIQSSIGSGVILSDEGHILTNLHVIDGADEIVVALQDGREANATIIGIDPEGDLAVLQIELSPLPRIEIAPYDSVSVGDVVLAIGNPFGVGQTVTMGIVSATDRSQLGINRYENYIQTDAAINQGNSGGALINAYGQLVGINSAIFTQSGGSEGVGFAIPMERALKTMTDIANYGMTIRGWLGIEVREATPELLDNLNLPSALTGLIVTGITPNGPADKAGLVFGDIITSINQQNARDGIKTMNLIANLRPGEEINIEFLREGKSMKTKTIAGQRGVDQ